MATYNLSNWGVTYLSDSIYLAPEINPVCLIGLREEDNQRVRTSSIVKADGRVIKTRSGSTYILGEPDSKYIEYLESIGYKYDSENPIKVKGCGSEG